MGETLTLEADLTSTAPAPRVLTVDPRKASGWLSPKVFEGVTLSLGPGESRLFRRRHRFAEVTTRRHYPGEQALSLRINGRDTPAAPFALDP